MATNYFPTSLEGQIGTAGSPVPIVSPAASEVWGIHTLTLTSITGVPVSVTLYVDALEYCSFDIPANDVVEFRWGGPGHVINPSSVFSIEVDLVDVINYKVDGVVGTATGAGAVISVEDDGFEVESDLVTLNFIGDGVTAATGGAGIVDVTIPGQTPIEVQEESGPVETNLTTLNFLGDGVTAATGGAGIVDVTVPGQVPIAVQEEGGPVEAALTTLNFLGAGVTAATGGAGIVEVTIPGGGGYTLDELHDYIDANCA
jgi:uncharacterized protein involved in tellurium resistance